jgi:hypothetical protein
MPTLHFPSQALTGAASTSRATAHTHAAGLVTACAGAGATAALLAPPPCSASAVEASSAPPPSVTITRGRVWTETELAAAPTKMGKLKRRRRGGGGGGDGGEENNLDDGGNYGGFGGFDDDGFGGGGDGQGDGWGGGQGGDHWMNNGGAGEEGNLFWAWQTMCGVAFVGSVQHIVEKMVMTRFHVEAGGMGRAAAGVGMGVVGAGAASVWEPLSGSRLCLGSITIAHTAHAMSISA